MEQVTVRGDGSLAGGPCERERERVGAGRLWAREKLGRPGGEAQLAIVAGWQESQGLLLSFWISVYLNKHLQ